MQRTIFILLIFFICTAGYSQDNPAESKLANVNVVVTDRKGKPSKGEQVLFRSESTKEIVSSLSDAMGKFSLRLPVGDKYIITVKSITDSTKYGSFTIPALPTGESYSEPFNVSIKFEAARSYTLDNVHFDFGKATLRAGSFAELEELVSYLRNKEDIKAEIAGHTDNVGKDADNLKLSQQRADAIRTYVIKKGIQPARVTAKGYGAAEPVADNDTEDGRQLNRRTEVRIL